MLTYMHILSLCFPLLYYLTARNLSFKADHTGGQRFSLFIQTNFITFFSLRKIDGESIPLQIQSIDICTYK